jgi:2-polyprenyl-3-methyl-5-hydroxy-6-metoxy-1,4-benzoquinol methylase
MNSNNVANHFDEKSTMWDELYDRPAFKDRLALFSSQVLERVDQNAQVLDYGCGSGMLSFSLARQGYKVKGVDVSAGMIDLCKQKNQEACQGSNNIHASFELVDSAVPLMQPASYDCIVSSSVLEYIEDDEAVLKQFSTWLKPGGKLFFSVPHAGSLTAWVEDNVVAMLKKGAQRDVNFCQRRYDLNKLQTTLHCLGFSVSRITHFEFPRLGSFGVTLSRNKIFGLLSLIEAEKAA